LVGFTQLWCIVETMPRPNGRLSTPIVDVQDRLMIAFMQSFESVSLTDDAGLPHIVKISPSTEWVGISTGTP
jgi:hypothetical protein